MVVRRLRRLADERAADTQSLDRILREVREAVRELQGYAQTLERRMSALDEHAGGDLGQHGVEGLGDLNSQLDADIDESGAARPHDGGDIFLELPSFGGSTLGSEARRITDLPTSLSQLNYRVLVDNTAPSGTMSLPSAPVDGQEIVILVDGAYTGTLTIDGNGADENGFGNDWSGGDAGRFVYDADEDEWWRIG